MQRLEKFFSLFAGALVTKSIFIATFLINEEHRKTDAGGECRKLLVEFYPEARDAIERLPALSVTERDKITRRQQLVSEFLREQCGIGKVVVPDDLAGLYEKISRFAPDRNVQKSLGVTARGIADENETPGASGAAPSLVNSTVPPPPPDNAIGEAKRTLYVHFSQAADRDSVNQLISELQASDRSINVPQPELVAVQAKSTLRCLKKADCDAAQPLLALVRGTIGDDRLELLELDQTYEDAIGVKPGTYELWLAPGALQQP